MKNLLPLFIQQQYQQHNFAGRFAACSMFVDISGFTSTTEALIASGQAEGVEVLSEAEGQRPDHITVIQNGSDLSSPIPCEVKLPG